MNLYPGSTEDYFRHIDHENAVARVERAKHERAEADPSFQCHHGVSLYCSCRPCGVEVGE